MELTRGLHRTGPFDAVDLCSRLTKAGHVTLPLPDDRVVDKASFIDAIRAAFPLDPPLEGSDNWDALRDSLWGGLFVHPASRIAIVWPNARAMEASAQADFEIAIDVLADIAITLGEARFTNDKPKDVTVLVDSLRTAAVNEGASFYAIEPEVAGGFGEDTRITRSPGKRFIVDHLHYQFEGWLGDELLESTPCFIATNALTKELERRCLTGFSIDDVEVSVSEEFRALKGELTLPEFRWLKIDGIAGIDDFGLSAGLLLVVSRRALEVLNGRIAHAASVVAIEG